jgi:hypothetical protein
MSEMSSEQYLHELGSSYELLQRCLGGAKHFASAYGHFTDVAKTVVADERSVGYLTSPANKREAHISVVEPFTLCLRRDHLLANWPLRQVRWFLAGNSRLATSDNDLFPDR